jgi:hypothetical protein
MVSPDEDGVDIEFIQKRIRLHDSKSSVVPMDRNGGSLRSGTSSLSLARFCMVLDSPTPAVLCVRTGVLSARRCLLCVQARYGHATAFWKGSAARKGGVLGPTASFPQPKCSADSDIYVVFSSLAACTCVQR